MREAFWGDYEHPVAIRARLAQIERLLDTLPARSMRGLRARLDWMAHLAEQESHRGRIEEGRLVAQLRDDVERLGARVRESRTPSRQDEDGESEETEGIAEWRQTPGEPEPMIETTRRARNTVYVGVLSDVMEITGIAGMPELVGTLRGTANGIRVETRLRVDVTRTETLRARFREGPIALYGEMRPLGFVVKGVDLRRGILPSPPERSPRTRHRGASADCGRCGSRPSRRATPSPPETGRGGHEGRLSSWRGGQIPAVRRGVAPRAAPL